MRKVTIVVLVLITSCQVSLKPKSGPLIAQATIVASASVKVIGRPLMRADAFAKRLNHDFFVHALKANGVGPCLSIAFCGHSSPSQTSHSQRSRLTAGCAELNGEFPEA